MTSPTGSKLHTYGLSTQGRVSELTRPLKAGKGYSTLKTIIEQKMNRPEPSSVDFRIALAVAASRLEEAILKVRPVSSSDATGLVPPGWDADNFP